MIDKEAYEEWLAHPVTEQVRAALRKLAERNKEKWMEISWNGGKADQETLVELRSHAEMANDLSELTFEELSEVLDEPERHKPD